MPPAEAPIATMVVSRASRGIRAHNLGLIGYSGVSTPGRASLELTPLNSDDAAVRGLEISADVRPQLTNWLDDTLFYDALQEASYVPAYSLSLVLYAMTLK